SEIPAPASGVLKEILFQEGDVVPVKEKIAVIDTEGGAAGKGAAETSAASTPAPEEKSAEAETTKGETRETPTTSASSPGQATSPAPETRNTAASSPSSSGDTRFYSPVVRSLAEKHGISGEQLAEIQGTGQGGRVTKQDFLQYVESGPSQSQRNEAPPSPAATAPAVRPAPPSVSERYEAPVSDVPTGEWNADGTKVVPMDNMRKLIAAHMVRSKQTSPHVYSVQEVDCSQIAKWRAKHKNDFKQREGFSLSFTPFFLEAAVRGLLEFPMINSSVDGNAVIMKKKINLGCAVALGNSGLIVPVIKSAEERNFVGIARGLNDLALRARKKQLLPDEVAGGTFTVTNPGVFGTMIGTPIINQPQVAILCLGQIKKRPVVVNDMIAIREICYLTLSYDHRIVDGALGGQFLAFVREYLENWDQERPLY
ncbi:2-oxo acid dehydrogenase subunit E2, partial [bacterium]|nr:2-oxo acid dehydrogenase subunit E2 [bacterium]